MTPELRNFLKRPGPDPRGPAGQKMRKQPTDKQPELSELQEMAAVAGVQRLLGASEFDVGRLDALLLVVRRIPSTEDRAALAALDGLTWSCMGASLAQHAREECLRLLGMPPSIASMVLIHEPAETLSWAKRLRLAFRRMRPGQSPD